MLLRTGGVPTSITFIVLAMAVGLSGLYGVGDDDVGLNVLRCRADILGTKGVEHRGDLFIGTRPPHP